MTKRTADTMSRESTNRAPSSRHREERMRSSSGNRTFPPPFLSLSHTQSHFLSLFIYLSISFLPFLSLFLGALGSSSLISTAQTVRHAVARYCYANDFCASEEPPGRSKTSRAAAKADLTCCNAHGKICRRV